MIAVSVILLLLSVLSTNIPVVTGKRCDKGLGHISNGFKMSPSYYFYPGEILKIGCNEGFTRDGVAQAVCLEDGNWLNSPEVPCIPLNPNKSMVCNGSPDIENGAVLEMEKRGQYKKGDIVNISCSEGYNQHEMPVAICLGDDQWKLAPNQPCFRSGCDKRKALTIKNGRIMSPQEYFSYGDRIKIGCNHGFTRDGVAVAVCLEDGDWIVSPEVPCVALNPDQSSVCTGSPTIPNGAVPDMEKRGQYKKGDIVNISCSEGYIQHEMSVAICLGYDTWKLAPNTPCFRTECSPPKVLLGRYLDEEGEERESYPISTRLELKCIPGYEPEYNSALECMEDAQWSKPPGQCKAIGCKRHRAHNIGNGFILSRRDIYSPGEKEKIGCHKGFTRNGAAQAICIEGGHWISFPEEPCVAISPLRGSVCTGLPMIPHGEVVETEKRGHYGKGAIINFRCIEEYIHREGSVAVCMGSNEWKLAPGNPCFKAGCPPPPKAFFGRYVKEGEEQRSFPLSTKLRLKCLPGFIDESNSTIECLRNGEWSRNTPGQCIDINHRADDKAYSGFLYELSLFCTVVLVIFIIMTISKKVDELPTYWIKFAEKQTKGIPPPPAKELPCVEVFRYFVYSGHEGGCKPVCAPLPEKK